MIMFLNKIIIKLFIFIFCVILFNEYIIYYLIINKCNWPLINHQEYDNNYIKVMLLADPHLLGRIKGHWFDKLRREWQMYRSYQTSLQLLQPQTVIILGDIFDEGLWAYPDDFARYLSRFNEIFTLPDNQTKIYVVVGNHDIGFHYWTNYYLVKRFENAFNCSSVDLITIDQINFVRINSMAMEGDGCGLCRQAEDKLREISAKISSKSSTSLKTSPGIVDDESHNKKIDSHSDDIDVKRPILLTHFPLYRQSEEICNEIDSANADEKMIKFRVKLDCLSQDATKLLFDLLKPRLVFSGHTHHSCIVKHQLNNDETVEEWTISSFSWRNKKNPSFLLARISKNDYFIAKCFLPNEYTIFIIYSVSIIFLICFLIYSIKSRFFVKQKLS